MSEAQNLESLVAHIIEVAKEAARVEFETVLDAMVILHVRLAHDLIDKACSRLTSTCGAWQRL